MDDAFFAEISRLFSGQPGRRAEPIFDPNQTPQLSRMAREEFENLPADVAIRRYVDALLRLAEVSDIGLSKAGLLGTRAFFLLALPPRYGTHDAHLKDLILRDQRGYDQNSREFRRRWAEHVIATARGLDPSGLPAKGASKVPSRRAPADDIEPTFRAAVEYAMARTGELRSAIANTSAEFPKYLIPSDLRRGPTRLVGRDDVLDRLIDIPGGCVVLSGAGGLGKTALTLTLASRIASRYPHGHVYLDVHGYSDDQSLRPQEALKAILASFGVETDGDTEALAVELSKVLGTRQVLVVVDNVRDRALIERLASISGDESILIVTTRASFTGLSSIEGVTWEDLELLSRHDSRELLETYIGPERLARSPEATERLLDAMDGLPLAIHLIGAGLRGRKGVQIDTLATDLVATSDLVLDASLHGTTASVARAIEWSWRGLSDDGRTLLSDVSSLHAAPSESMLKWLCRAAGWLEADWGRALSEVLGERLLEDSEAGGATVHDLVRSYVRRLSRMVPPEGDVPLNDYTPTFIAALNSIASVLEGGSIATIGSEPLLRAGSAEVTDLLEKAPQEIAILVELMSRSRLLRPKFVALLLDILTTFGQLPYADQVLGHARRVHGRFLDVRMSDAVERRNLVEARQIIEAAELGLMLDIARSGWVEPFRAALELCTYANAKTFDASLEERVQAFEQLVFGPRGPDLLLANARATRRAPELPSGIDEGTDIARIELERLAELEWSLGRALIEGDRGAVAATAAHIRREAIDAMKSDLPAEARWHLEPVLVRISQLEFLDYQLRRDALALAVTSYIDRPYTHPLGVMAMHQWHFFDDLPPGHQSD